MAVYNIEMTFEAALGVVSTKRDAEREAERLRDEIMGAIEAILFAAAPQPKGHITLYVKGKKPLVVEGRAPPARK